MSTNPPALSYSAAASRNVSTSNTKPNPPPKPAQTNQDVQQADQDAYVVDPAHLPRTDAEEQNVYVLTILTDKAHHDRMTALRRKYFPKRLNKLAAHLTLFHALPESRLKSHIIPTIKDVTSQTSRFDVYADKPFRLKRGMAVGISSSAGGNQGKQIHRKLQDAWMREDFLSEQDAGGCRLHYTLMNKVDDEMEVDNAFQDLTADFRGDRGVAEGLALWRYERGFWKWERKFEFADR